MDDAIDLIETTLHPRGSCTDCGGGEFYWKHGAVAASLGGHAFQPSSIHTAALSGDPCDPWGGMIPTGGLTVGRLTFVKEATGYRGVAALLRDTLNGRHYIVSAIMLTDLGWGSSPEVMVFASDENGKVTDWTDLDCWRGTPTLTEVMESFSAKLTEEG